MKQQRRSARVIGTYSAIAAVVLLVVLVEAWVSRRDAPAPTTPPPLRTNSAPAPALNRDIRTVLAGQQLYRFYCASCHSGASTASSSATASNLFAPAQLDQTADDAIYRTVADGASTGGMPAFAGRLTDAQIWQVIAFLRSNTLPSGTTALPAPPTSTTTATAQPAARARVSIPDSPELLPPLVFARDGNIWHSDGNDTPLRLLTQFTALEYADQPAYNTQTGRVAFVTSTLPISSATRLSVSALYTMKLDGTDRQLVWQTERGSLYLPTWASDGTALYVTFNGAEQGEATVRPWRPQIVRIDLASGARQPVVDNAHNQAPAPNGRQLAYVQVQEHGYATTLTIANVDGSNPRVLLRADLFSGFLAPRFSPDGKQIVVAAVGGPETDAHGVPTTAQLRAPFGALLDWIAPATAEAHNGVAFDLWRVDTDGSNLRRLTSFGEDLPMAVFSPDGSDIMIMAYGGVYRMKSNGSQLRRISLLGGHGAIDWLP
ncbi:MAG: c-type cytochrome [Roseiflexaceae bacterium]|nr:c-type cytochrome [Roseiflexaceae bacterium]